MTTFSEILAALPAYDWQNVYVFCFPTGNRKLFLQYREEQQYVNGIAGKRIMYDFEITGVVFKKGETGAGKLAREIADKLGIFVA